MVVHTMDLLDISFLDFYFHRGAWVREDRSGLVNTVDAIMMCMRLGRK